MGEEVRFATPTVFTNVSPERDSAVTPVSPWPVWQRRISIVMFGVLLITCSDHVPGDAADSTADGDGAADAQQTWFQKRR